MPLANPAREKRQSTRKVLLSKAIFISLNITSKFASTIDLSANGLSLTLPAPLKTGQVCAITFDVPADDIRQRALISGRVASCIEKGVNEFRVGIRFVQADHTSKELIRAALEKYLSATV